MQNKDRLVQCVNTKKNNKKQQTIQTTDLNAEFVSCEKLAV